MLDEVCLSCMCVIHTCTLFQAQMKHPQTPTSLSPPPPPLHTFTAHTAMSSTTVCSQCHSVALVILMPAVITGSVGRDAQCVRVEGTEEEEDSQFVTSGSFLQTKCMHTTQISVLCVHVFCMYITLLCLSPSPSLSMCMCVE